MKRKYEIAGREYVLGRYIDLDKEVVLDSGGERITEARAQEMAEYALQQVYAKRGRPSLTGPSSRSPQISFRVPESLARRAEEAAARQGKTLSQLSREALERYLEAS
jgi:predicted HicB family RNase H-like nuclease